MISIRRAKQLFSLGTDAGVRGDGLISRLDLQRVRCLGCNFGALGYGKGAVQMCLSMLFALALSTSYPSVASKCGTLTDGKAILEKSFGTYARMTSYYGRANTDSLLVDTKGRALKQVGSSVEMKYKLPNKLYLSFMTPVGSRIVWSTSTDLGIFDPGTNKYSITPTAPNLTAMLPLLFHKASISASFDPLYALSHTPLPRQITHLSLQGQSTYNGHPVYIVTADLITKSSIHWTWYIDRSSFLLYKIEQVTPPFDQKFRYKQNGQVKQGQRRVSIMLRTVVADARPNAPIAEADFDFKPPSGASVRIKPPVSDDKH